MDDEREKKFLATEGNKMKWDLICMGRAAVDLYSMQIGDTLEESCTFAKYLGGCPANIACGTARLGLKSAMLSRVGDEAMGRFVAKTLEDEGVDISLLQKDPERLTGLVLLGIDPPDKFPLIFYRENCADMAITEEDIEKVPFSQTKALLITGTHISQKSVFAATKKAVLLAKKSNCKIIFDLDFRPVLWKATSHGEGDARYSEKSTAAKSYEEFFSYCDVIVGTEEEIKIAAGIYDIEKAIDFIREKTDALIVRKQGEKGSLAYPGAICNPVTAKSFPVVVLNVLGAGDAFLSGFLRGYLRDLPLVQCLTLANAAGALVVTRHGCAPAIPFWEELQAFIEGAQNCDDLHETLSRRCKKEITFLAFDHRAMFEGDRHATQFKEIIFDGLELAVQGKDKNNIGLIIDDLFSKEILKKGKTAGFTVARCIEEANVSPLQFLGRQEAACILRSWPKSQVVKVLSRGEIAELHKLFRAVTETAHRLMIEFIGNEEQVVRWIEECYQTGILPTWWKLPPFKNGEVWDKIESLIEEYDPENGAILLLGDNRPFDELEAIFNNNIPRVTGFAVGRTIWGPVREKWKKAQITDEQAATEIGERFCRLLNIRDTHGKNNPTNHGASAYLISDETKSRAI